jgi:hypothetical protein
MASFLKTSFIQFQISLSRHIPSFLRCFPLFQEATTRFCGSRSNKGQTLPVRGHTNFVILFTLEAMAAGEYGSRPWVRCDNDISSSHTSGLNLPPSAQSYIFVYKFVSLLHCSTWSASAEREDHIS